MKIKNVSSSKVIIDDVGAKGVNIKLEPGEIKVIFDEDAEKSPALKKLIDAGFVQKIGDEEPSIGPKDVTQKIIDWIISNDVAIRFVKEGTEWDSGQGKFVTTNDSIPIQLKVCDGDGTIDTFNSTATVAVASTGSATIVETMPIAFTNGIATITVNNSVDEEITLSLSGGNTSLDLTDTVNVIFQ